MNKDELLKTLIDAERKLQEVSFEDLLNQECKRYDHILEDVMSGENNNYWIYSFLVDSLKILINNNFIVINKNGNFNTTPEGLNYYNFWDRYNIFSKLDEDYWYSSLETIYDKSSIDFNYHVDCDLDINDDPTYDNREDNFSRENWKTAPEEVKRWLFYLDNKLDFKQHEDYACI